MKMYIQLAFWLMMTAQLVACGGSGGGDSSSSSTNTNINTDNSSTPANSGNTTTDYVKVAAATIRIVDMVHVLSNLYDPSECEFNPNAQSSRVNNSRGGFAIYSIITYQSCIAGHVTSNGNLQPMTGVFEGGLREIITRSDGSEELRGIYKTTNFTLGDFEIVSLDADFTDIQGPDFTSITTTNNVQLSVRQNNMTHDANDFSLVSRFDADVDITGEGVIQVAGEGEFFIDSSETYVINMFLPTALDGQWRIRNAATNETFTVTVVGQGSSVQVAAEGGNFSETLSWSAFYAAAFR